MITNSFGPWCLCLFDWFGISILQELNMKTIASIDAIGIPDQNSCLHSLVYIMAGSFCICANWDLVRIILDPGLWDFSWWSVSLIPWAWLYFKWFLLWFLGFCRSVTFRRHWHSWQVFGQNVHILTWFVCLMWIAIFQIQPNFGEVNSQFYKLLMLVAQNHSL